MKKAVKKFEFKFEHAVLVLIGIVVFTYLQTLASDVGKQAAQETERRLGL